MKYLRTTMPDESQWDVPAELIAKSRAAYYAKLDSESGEGDYERLYALHFESTLTSYSFLIEWAENNMNWSDVSHAAVQVESSMTTDYQEGWTNGEKEVVEKA